MEHLPITLRSVVDEGHVTPINIGHSNDQVYRIEADAIYYLKIGSSLTAECERLQWLQGRLPVPEVVHFEVNQGKHYLLTTGMAGEILSSVVLPAKRCTELMAEAARMMHGLPIAECPFQWPMTTQIADARHQLDQGRINTARFDDRYYGKSGQELFADLLNAIPDDDEDPVVTHGDLCLPNVLVDVQRGTISGFIDVGDLSVSDRHLDLVLAALSIRYNLGGKYINAFYGRYGAALDPVKFHFYSILNEFV